MLLGSRDGVQGGSQSQDSSRGVGRAAQGGREGRQRDRKDTPSCCGVTSGSAHPGDPRAGDSPWELSSALGLCLGAQGCSSIPVVMNPCPLLLPGVCPDTNSCSRILCQAGIDSCPSAIPPGSGTHLLPTTFPNHSQSPGAPIPAPCRALHPQDPLVHPLGYLCPSPSSRKSRRGAQRMDHSRSGAQGHGARVCQGRMSPAEVTQPPRDAHPAAVTRASQLSPKARIAGRALQSSTG